MRPGTILDSAHFQLTPTRTRCDLVISANGKNEKIATGLLNPFLAHLKTAQEQIAKGGYSIILKPAPGSDATWFTKDTVERFVRFVSTPEILERVYTIESEILQIEKATTIQSNNNVGMSTKIEDQQPKLLDSIIQKEKVRKPGPDANEEKAIVLYKPDEQLSDANSQKPLEENSKVQLLRVLETRKAMLQKEQGMAFARAVAAGFDIDHMTPLILFSQCFRASRLMDASKRFIELWKRKHETGQWLEIEAADAMASRSEFASMNSSGIILSSDINCGELNMEENGKATNEARADEKYSVGQQVPAGLQDYMHGHFPNPMYPPWPMQSPPAAPPVYHAYPVQGMPYYQNYPGYGPFFQPPYPSPEESRSGSGKKRDQRRHSMDSKDDHVESQDDSESDKESSQNNGLNKKASRSGKKIVIRNINYITSNKKNASGNESGTDNESDEESGELQTDATDMKLQSSSGYFRGKGSQSKSIVEDALDGKQADVGQWQAFQNFLLSDADEDKHAMDQGMFVSEKGAKIKRRQYMEGGDPLASGRQNPMEIGEAADFNTIGGNVARMKRGVNDELFKGHSGGGTEYRNEHNDVMYVEEGGRMVGYRRTGNDDFMIRGMNQTKDNMSFSSDPLAGNVFDQATGKLDSSSCKKIGDESYIVPFRSISLDEHGTAHREALDLESELPSSVQMVHNNSNGRQANYEPNDLGMLPERGTEQKTTGYDPALDYEMQLHAVNKMLDVVPDNNKGSKSLDKNQKSNDTLDKKKNLGPVRKVKPSKPSPLDDARARAEKLRSYKSDLQKLKKEKEEEASKRIEALKLERQKRIAARTGSNPAQSPLPSQNTRKSLTTKMSPGPLKGSKFSDSAPGLSSPLQRSSIRTVSLASSGSKEISKPRSSTGTYSAGNRLTHSASSLGELKENTGVTPESKASMERIRRLSEPKVSSSYIPSVRKKNTKATPVKASKVTSDRPESKEISAIINLDKTKAATLPELKIRTPKGPSNSQNTAVKMVIHTGNGSKSPVSSKPSQNKNLVSQKSDEDDNPIVEKTVVMSEPEKPSTSKEHILDDRMGKSSGYHNNHQKGDEPQVSNYGAIHAPVSQPAVYKADGEPTQYRLRDHDNTHEVLKAAEVLPNSSSTSGVDKPYQAPYARVSSLEDPSTKNSEYGKAPSTSLDMRMEQSETVKTHIANFNNMKLEKASEALEKPQKESSKGFKRLLKFGRKNQNSAGERESDTMSAKGSEVEDSAANSALSSDVHTLKNLICRDETPTGSNTPQKSSRHFSLLSPFRGKNSEKKVTS